MIHGNVLGYPNHDEQKNASQASKETISKACDKLMHLIKAGGLQITAREQQSRREKTPNETKAASEARRNKEAERKLQSSEEAKSTTASNLVHSDETPLLPI